MLKFKNNFFKINTCGEKVALWTPTLVGGNGKFFVGGGVHQSPQLGTTHPGKGHKKIKAMTASPPTRLLATTDYIWWVIVSLFAPFVIIWIFVLLPMLDIMLNIYTERISSPFLCKLGLVFQ